MINMKFLLISTLALNAGICLIAGALVYFKNKNRMQNSLWFVYNILFCAWNFFIYRALDSFDSASIIYWFRTSMVSLIFLAPVFLHFLSVYSDREVFKKRVIANIYTLFFLIFVASFAFPEEFIKGISSGVYFSYLIEPGIIFHVFTLCFVGFIVCGFYYLLRPGKAYLNFRSNQRTWLFFGMLLSTLAPLGFLLSTYGISIVPIGIFLVIPYLALVSYVILMHYVQETRVFVNKMVLYGYGALFVILIQFFVVHLVYRIVGVDYFQSSVISGCIILLGLLFLVHYEDKINLKKAANNIVYEKHLAYYQFLENFNSVASRLRDLDAIMYYSVDSIKDIISVNYISLYLYDENTSEFRLKASRGYEDGKGKGGRVENIAPNNKLLKFFSEGNVYVSDEKKDFTEDYDMKTITDIFDSINAKLSIPLQYSMPLYYKMNIVGFLNLGSKKDNTPYTQEDIDILNAFGRQISICIDNAKLYSSAIEDDLTLLYRVNYFNRRIQEEMDRSDRYKRSFSVIMLDVDDFKNINDEFGHQVGDDTLRKLAFLIKSNVRRADIAGRYGGEEFSILMPETSEKKGLVAAERLRKIIEDNFKENEKRFSVTVSIGVCEYRTGMKRHELIKNADQALYKAKRAGKNVVHSLKSSAKKEMVDKEPRINTAHKRKE